MALFIFDKKEGTLVRAVCPNCRSRNPVIRSTLDGFTVLYPACGAFEEVKDGRVVTTIECRVERPPSTSKRRS